jgi:hypothetical protein
MLASVRTLALGKPPSQAGLCSGNRQNKVNAMLTIVINLRFTQIRLNGPAVNEKGGQAAFVLMVASEPLRPHLWATCIRL